MYVYAYIYTHADGVQVVKRNRLLTFVTSVNGKCRFTMEKKKTKRNSTRYYWQYCSSITYFFPFDKLTDTIIVVVLFRVSPPFHRWPRLYWHQLTRGVYTTPSPRRRFFPVIFSLGCIRFIIVPIIAKANESVLICR